MITDRYKRKINYLRLSVTDRCNLRCIYCLPENGIQLVGKEELLTYEEIIRAVKIFAQLGIEKIRVTGGEPLLREGVTRLIEEVGKVDGVKEVFLTTNGTLLKNYLPSLKKAKVKGINISIDSLDREKYRKITRGGNLDTVLEGLNLATSIGFKVKINVVISHFLDAGGIEGFARLSKQYPVRVRFIEEMPLGSYPGAGYAKNNGIARVFRILKRHRKYYKEENIEGNGPAIYYTDRQNRSSIGFIINHSHFCQSCNRIRLTSTGKLSLCLYSGGGLDIRKMLRDGLSNEEIGKSISDFVKNKPKNRKQSSTDQVYMNQIGG